MTLLELLLEHQAPWPEDADFCYLEDNSIIFRRDSDNQLICVASHRYTGIPYGNRVTKQEYLMTKKGEHMSSLADYDYSLELIRKLQEHLIATLPEGAETLAFQKLEELKEDMDWLYTVEPTVSEMRKHLDLEDYSYTEESMIFNVLKELAKAGFRKQELKTDA